MPTTYFAKKVILRNKKKKRRIFLKTLIWLFFLSFFALGGILLYFYFQLPNPQDFETRIIRESTKIYDKEGKVLLFEAGKSAEGEEVVKRTYVSLDEISPYLQKAIIAAEDRNFYHHPGIDIKGLGRAILKAIFTKGKEIQGASTITQQLIKNSFLTPEKTIQRKIKEAIMAFQMERRYSKEKILEFYLNQINFGSVFYGVESASQNYFKKSAKDLSLAEATTLASLVRAPTFYLKDPEAREKRKNYILEEMVKLKMLDEKEAKMAKDEKVEISIPPSKMIAPYFTQEVMEILENMFGSDYGRMGFRVWTTLDIKLQTLAEKVIEEQKEKLEKYFGAENAALLAIDPRNGDILAMVGGNDFEKNQVNIWTPKTAEGFQSPGSAFKPIVYAAAFLKGYTKDTILWDVKTNFSLNEKPYIPLNFDFKERGPVKMEEALGQSLNIPAVKTLYLAGIENTIELAKKMGMINSFNKKIDPTEPGLSMAIGGKGIVPLELVSAFGVFANEGVRFLPQFIKKIEDKNGKVIYEPETYPIQALDSEIAKEINWILSQNDLRAPMFGVSSWLNLGSHIAVKTGTAANENEKVTDLWTIGYTKNLVVGVWVGNNFNEPLKGKAEGAIVAAPIWHQFMKEATKDEPKIPFPKPKIPPPGKPILAGFLPNQTVTLDLLSQKLATELTPSHLRETKKFPLCDSILYWVNKDDPQGPYPKNPSSDPMFKNWEEGVKNWCAKNKLVPPKETTPFHIQENIPQITLIEKKIKKVDNLKQEINFSIKINAPLKIKKIEVFGPSSENSILSFQDPSKNEFSFNFKVPDEISFQEKYVFRIVVYDIAENQGSFEVTLESQSQ